MGARVTLGALWLLAAVLLGATAWPFVAGGPAAPPGMPARPGAPVLPPTLADLALPPVESFAETLARPLFTATRRPPSPGEMLQGEARPVAVAPAAKGEKVILGKYLLRGVVVTPEQKLLLLKRQDTGAALRLREGDALDGWRIAAIAQDHLILSKGDRQERVPLRDRP